MPAPSAPLAGDSPEWFSFKPAEVELLKSPLGNLRLFFGKKNAVLYATDTGAGFRAGAPEAPKPVPQTANTGRLPRNSPPNPPPE